MEKFQLPEQDGHVVSYSVHGNQDGPAIISFHGGPGSKSKPYHAERYDLDKYRVILFDQRGCGESTPLGEVKNNTTEHLLNDAERIREKLSIESWFVSGGSWDSTLSLLYAIKHPERTKGLLIAAIFLCDRDSINWSFGEGGASTVMPDVWERRMDFFKKFNIKVKTQNEDILQALENADLETQKEITVGVFDWEGNLFTPHGAISYNNPADLDEKDIPTATPEMPHGYMPDYSVWKREFERFDITPETILVGHSCGGGFLVRWLSENKERIVGKVVLVAPWLDPNKTKGEDNDFFDFEMDTDLVKRTTGITIFNSDDDMEAVHTSVKTITETVLETKLVEFQGKGHFCLGDLGGEAFPELLDEVLNY